MTDTRDMTEGKILRQVIPLAVPLLLANMGLDVSNYAAKHPQKMYTDTANGPQQVGLVFKASTDIDNNGKWVRKYADIWAEVNEMYIPKEFTA